jgi:hypothetical protein
MGPGFVLVDLAAELDDLALDLGRILLADGAGNSLCQILYHFHFPQSLIFWLDVRDGRVGCALPPVFLRKAGQDAAQVLGDWPWASARISASAGEAAASARRNNFVMIFASSQPARAATAEQLGAQSPNSVIAPF